MLDHTFPIPWLSDSEFENLEKGEITFSSEFDFFYYIGIGRNMTLKSDLWSLQLA